jgi:hypothetical protein
MKLDKNLYWFTQHPGAHTDERFLLFASLQKVCVQGVLLIKCEMDAVVFDAEASQMVQATAQEALRLVEQNRLNGGEPLILGFGLQRRGGISKVRVRFIWRGRRERGSGIS